MRTTSYGIRVRPATNKRYGVRLSAAPVLSNQLQYALKVESRELIVASHPVTLPYYSIRSGHEEELIRARRREREFSASLIAPEVLQLKRKEDLPVELSPYLEMHTAEPEPVTLADHQSARNALEHNVELDTISAPSRRTREWSVSLDEVHGVSTQAEPREIAMTDEISASTHRNVEEVNEEHGDVLERLSRFLDAPFSDVPLLAMTTDTEHEVRLQEIDGMVMPLRPTEESRFDPAARIGLTHLAEEHRKNELERTTVPSETLELKTEHHTKTNDPQETRFDAIHSVDHNHDPIDVVESSIEQVTYQEKTYVAALDEPLRVSRDEIHHVEGMNPLAMSRVTTPGEAVIQDQDMVDVLDRVYATFESVPEVMGRDQVILATADHLLATDGTGRIEPVEVKGIQEAERRTETTLTEMAAMHQADSQIRIENVLLDSIQSGLRGHELAVDLNEMDSGSNTTVQETLVLDVLELADKVDVEQMAILDEMLDSDIPAYEVEESILYAAERQVLTVEAEKEETQLFERGHSQEEVHVAEPALARFERTYEAAIEELANATTERQHDADLQDLSAGERVSLTEDVILEESMHATLERMKDAVLSLTDEMERESGYQEAVFVDVSYTERGIRPALFDDQDMATRSAIYRLELVDHDELRTVATDAIFETHDEMGRTVKPAVMQEHHEAVLKERTFAAQLEEFLDAIPWIKKKKKIWLIPARGNHWNPLSHWKKTR